MICEENYLKGNWAFGLLELCQNCINSNGSDEKDTMLNIDG